MNIVIAGTIDLPADKRAEALAGAEPHIRAAQAENGCIAYDWSPDPYNPERVHVFEEWASQEDLAFHLTAPPYKDMLGHLGGFGILGSKTQKYRVDHIEPVYDPQGVPRADFFTAKN